MSKSTNLQPRTRILVLCSLVGATGCSSPSADSDDDVDSDDDDSDVAESDDSDSVDGSEMCVDDDDCNPSDSPCLQGTCEDGICSSSASNEGGACSASDLCHTGTCEDGTCVEQPVDCSGLDGVCVAGICNPQTGQCDAQPAADGMACVGAVGCVDAPTCVGGTCQDPDGGYLFYEDFSDNSAGWMMEGQWSIAPALAGCGDPAMDHTPTADNGLAGVNIGGCVDDGSLHPFRCLTSPIIDTEGQPSLWLTYHRILHVEYYFDHGTKMEVFDGADWVPVFFNSAEVHEYEWTYHAYDIAAYANPNMRVRWCETIYHETAPDGSWSVDDVTVGTDECNGSDR